jgi:hypothetical protein
VLLYIDEFFGIAVLEKQIKNFYQSIIVYSQRKMKSGGEKGGSLNGAAPNRNFRKIGTVKE